MSTTANEMDSAFELLAITAHSGVWRLTSGLKWSGDYTTKRWAIEGAREKAYGLAAKGIGSRIRLMPGEIRIQTGCSVR